MKKINDYPQLYPEINEIEIDAEADITVVRDKEYEENLNFNDPKMIEFFKRLAQSSSKISNEAIPIISKFIRHSKLMEKVEAEYNNEKKHTFSALCDLCAGLLQFRELKKGEILFRIHDLGDKFFFVINGKLSLLKPKEITKVKMTTELYLRYLLYLKRNEEMYILQEIMRKNYALFPIETIEYLTLLYRIVFVLLVKSSLNRRGFGLKELECLFKSFDYTYDDFRINPEMINELWSNKSQRFINGEAEWEKFISKKFKLTTSEGVLYERYQHLMNENDKKEWICVQFEVIIYFRSRAFFGDNALDSVEKRRFGSVRAEENSIIAYMKDSDYISLIAPNRKKQKAKEISFLSDNFFLRNISTHLFEKNYYHQFTMHNYLKNHVLFQSGAIPKELIFLQEGKAEIRIKCSVVDLHNMIKYLIDEITKLPYFVQGTVRYPPILSKSKIGELKLYLKDSVLTRMKSKAEKFIQEMNRIHSFQLFILAPNEIIGIEEMILKIPYLTTAQVLTVNASFFKLEAVNLEKIISEEKSIFYLYSKLAANKLVSLIERLYHLKTSSVQLALFKLKQNEELLFKSASNSHHANAYSLTTELEYLSPKQSNPKDKVGSHMLNSEEHIKARQSLTKLKKEGQRKTKHRIIFSNPQLVIDTNGVKQHNLNIDISSLCNNLDDKISSIEEREQEEKLSFFEFKNKCVSLSQIQQELEALSSIDESQNVIQVVAHKKSDYEMVNHPSLFNYSKFPNHNNTVTKHYQTMKIAELASSNFHMSYVPLLGKKSKMTPYSSPRNSLSPIKYDNMTERTRMKQFSLIETEKIPFIANFKKSVIYSKGLQHHYPSEKSQSNQPNQKHLFLHNDLQGHEEPNIIPTIVKNYYQSIKNSGYSILANSPHNNTYLKKKLSLNKEKLLKLKRVRVSKSCNEISHNI